MAIKVFKGHPQNTYPISFPVKTPTFYSHSIFAVDNAGI